MYKHVEPCYRKMLPYIFSIVSARISGRFDALLDLWAISYRFSIYKLSISSIMSALWYLWNTPAVSGTSLLYHMVLMYDSSLCD